jgi:AAA ATPase domain
MESLACDPVPTAAGRRFGPVCGFSSRLLASHRIPSSGPSLTRSALLRRRQAVGAQRRYAGFYRAAEMIAGLSCRNFRSIERVDVPMSQLTAIVGPNGSGKTSVLRAIGLPLSEFWPPDWNRVRCGKMPGRSRRGPDSVGQRNDPLSTQQCPLIESWDAQRIDVRMGDAPPDNRVSRPAPSRTGSAHPMPSALDR